MGVRLAGASILMDGLKIPYILSGGEFRLLRTSLGGEGKNTADAALLHGHRMQTTHRW